jgi:hypothetical protein
MRCCGLGSEATQKNDNGELPIDLAPKEPSVVQAIEKVREFA